MKPSNTELLLYNCKMCPRGCCVNRLSGEAGVCGAVGAGVKIARAALHFWEEPCISGVNGSGAIFFSHCALQCVYCQNREISNGKIGADITIPRLADIMLELQDKGAHNINLVTPTHYVPQILDALDIAKTRGLILPCVYNSSGYETVETVKLLKGYIDIYLTDFKYSDIYMAQNYSGAGDYSFFANLAIEEMVCQIGPPILNSEGLMQKGVIVRHLILPGRSFSGIRQAKRIIHHLHECYGNRIYFSIMKQYTPPLGQFTGEQLELNRKITDREYTAVIDYAERIGVENAYIQYGDAAQESFIPAFDLEGVLAEEHRITNDTEKEK